MDFFEGLLLGPVWTDTDYDTKRHYSTYFIFSLSLVVLVLYTIIFRHSPWLIDSQGVKIGLFIFITLTTPFLGCFYYRLHPIIRIVILLLQLFKWLLLLFVLVGFFTPVANLSLPEIQNFALDFLNKTLEEFTNRFAEKAGAMSTVYGVVAGGFYIMLIILGVLAGVIILPAILTALLRQIQILYDRLLYHCWLKNYVDRN